MLSNTGNCWTCIAEVLIFSCKWGANTSSSRPHPNLVHTIFNTCTSSETVCTLIKLCTHTDYHCNALCMWNLVQYYCFEYGSANRKVKGHLSEEQQRSNIHVEFCEDGLIRRWPHLLQVGVGRSQCNSSYRQWDGQAIQWRLGDDPFSRDEGGGGGNFSWRIATHTIAIVTWLRSGYLICTAMLE